MAGSADKEVEIDGRRRAKEGGTEGESEKESWRGRRGGGGREVGRRGSGVAVGLGAWEPGSLDAWEGLASSPFGRLPRLLPADLFDFYCLIVVI